jgi:hypothetical protein
MGELYPEGRARPDVSRCQEWARNEEILSVMPAARPSRPRWGVWPWSPGKKSA